MAQIREVLLREWNPTGVGDNPNLEDEYDCFIPRIYKVLAGNASIAEIVDVLKTIENEELEIHSDNDSLFTTAARLKKIDMKLI